MNADRAMAAIVRQEVAAQQVSVIRRAIGEALSQCPVYLAAEAGAILPSADVEKYYDGKYVRTHLHEALAHREPCDSGYGVTRLDADGVADWLTECDACSRAWTFILARKAARAELGIAKRAIRAIGRAELNRQAMNLRVVP